MMAPISSLLWPSLRLTSSLTTKLLQPYFCVYSSFAWRKASLGRLLSPTSAWVTVPMYVAPLMPSSRYITRSGFFIEADYTREGIPPLGPYKYGFPQFSPSHPLDLDSGICSVWNFWNAAGTWLWIVNLEIIKKSFMLRLWRPTKGRLQREDRSGLKSQPIPYCSF